MLLLCLPENKGGEDYTWISSLFMERSNPLQPRLPFKWQDPEAAGCRDAAPRCGLQGACATG